MTTEPTFALASLGTMLEQARQVSGYTAADAAREANVHPTTLRRWEKGQVPPGAGDVVLLAQLYAVDAAEAKVWKTLAAQGKVRGLFEGSSVPANMRALLAGERRAPRIRALELEHIPGLAQTPGYHLSIQTVGLPVDPETSAAVRALRLQRQEAMFGRRTPPQLEFIIGPAALFYLRAWPDVEAEQLTHLRDLAQRPNIDIRVITGPHAGMLGSFTMLSPPKGSMFRPVVYLESQDGIRYVEDLDVVSDYAATFDAVRIQSQSIEEYLS